MHEMNIAIEQRGTTCDGSIKRQYKWQYEGDKNSNEPHICDMFLIFQILQTTSAILGTIEFLPIYINAFLRSWVYLLQA